MKAELPIEDEPLLAPAVAAAAPAPIAAAQERISLLLVDDDGELRRMFSRFFSQRGFQITTAEDGVEGCEVAARGGFDVVVADLSMPHLDGWGLLRKLREDYRTRELPVAFLTSYDDLRESLNALEAGAQGYFSKATRLDALAQQIRRLLEPHRAFRRQVELDQSFAFSVEEIGPQWTLRELERRCVTARLEAQDSWASYHLQLEAGQPRYACAQAGAHRAVGERAFNAFIASRGAEGMLTFTTEPVADPNLDDAPLEEMIEKAVATLNSNEMRARERLLIHGTRVQVNPDLYQVYSGICPEPWLEAVRLLCEERLPVREVMARVARSPLEVEDLVRDLVRRGVVTLSVEGE